MFITFLEHLFYKIFRIRKSVVEKGEKKISIALLCVDIPESPRLRRQHILRLMALAVQHDGKRLGEVKHYVKENDLEKDFKEMLAQKIRVRNTELGEIAWKALRDRGIKRNRRFDQELKLLSRVF